MREESDSELMRRVRAGQSACLGELFRRHHRRFYGFFLKACGRRHLSEDLLQDCFLRLLRYAPSFQDGADFLPWAFVVARNVLADQRGRERRLALEEGSETEGCGPQALDPAYLRELGEAESQLQRALLQLQPEQRELILLSKLRELSVPDLARLFGCSEAALKVRVHRALQMLRELCESEALCK